MQTNPLISKQGYEYLEFLIGKSKTTLEESLNSLLTVFPETSYRVSLQLKNKSTHKKTKLIRRIKRRIFIFL